MNATALKAMRTHWPQMMAALLRIRAAFLRRFAEAADGMTVGHLERLATLVLSVPTMVSLPIEPPSMLPADVEPLIESPRLALTLNA